MAELTQGGEVAYSPKTMQVWKALLNWLGFFVQIFFQILRALGHHPLLSSSSSSSSASEPSFKSLPAVELVEHDSPAASAVEIADSPDSDSEHPPEKLTVLFLWLSSNNFLFLCDNCKFYELSLAICVCYVKSGSS